MSILAGTSISDCSNLPTPVQGQDGYFIARPTHKESDQYLNNRIDYSDLLDNMVDYVMQNIRFGSMAYELSTDYSFSNHTHNVFYNKINVVEYTTVPTPNVVAGQITIRTYNASDRTYSTAIRNILVPSPIRYRTDTPKLYEIKLLATSTPRTVNTQADDFDGWVYADGSTYDFGGETVYVPVLSDFFKCTTKTNLVYPTTQAALITAYANPTLTHYHSVDSQKLQGENLKMPIKIPQSGSATSDKSMHGANATSPAATKYYTTSLQLKVKSVKFSGTSTQNPVLSEEERGETHPSFNFVQVMIFIGKKKWVKR